MNRARIPLRRLVVMAVLLCGAVPAAEAQGAGLDETASRLNACVDAFGRTGPCEGLLGWCDPVWGIARREACEARRHETADAVLNARWRTLRDAITRFDARNGHDDTPPLKDALLAEQRAWLAFRDAACGWLMRHVDSRDVTGDTERRLQCLTGMTLARIDRFRWLEYEALSAGAMP